MYHEVTGTRPFDFALGTVFAKSHREAQQVAADAGMSGVVARVQLGLLAMDVRSAWERGRAVL